MQSIKKILDKGKHFWGEDSIDPSAVHNILLIGRSGNGKSTLANVLSNTQNCPEGDGSTSKTKEIKAITFEDQKTKYCVIDTPGISDTKLSNDQVLDIIAEAVYLVKDGLNQVLFVTDVRFDQYEMATYDLLRTLIFDQKITKHTTVVRTHFASFTDQVNCKKDLKSLAKESKQLTEIITSCRKKIVHVSNPPVDIDEKEELSLNREDRQSSREKLLEHLQTTCQSNYKPPKLQQLSDEIVQYMDDKIKLKKDLEQLKALESKGNKKVNSAHQLPEHEDSNLLSEVMMAHRDQLLSKEKAKKTVRNEIKHALLAVETTGANEINQKIIHLESEKERLQRQIREKETVVRQKVLKHIFNNHREIKSTKGGEVFLNKVVSDWQQIHPDFARQELIGKWVEQDFTYQQVQEWANTLITDFNPQHDAGFCAWLRDSKKITVWELRNYKLTQLKKEYCNKLDKEVELLDTYLPQLDKELTKSVVDSTQQWLDENYLKSKRKQITKLNISKKNLAGELDLTDFTNLESLNSRRNNLAKVSLAPEASEKIKEIDFSRNYNLGQDCGLSYFSNLVNLEVLNIAATAFAGSLWPLANLKKLQILDIGGTNINAGLEYLPESVDYLFTNSEHNPNPNIPNPQVAKIRKQLAPYGYALKDWRKKQKALNYLAANYSPKTRKEVKRLNLSNQNFTGSLGLRDFVNLEELNCADNQLTNLDLTNLVNLQVLAVGGNQLTEIPLPPHPEKLTGYAIWNNNFPAQEPTFLTMLPNLTMLDISGNNFTKAEPALKTYLASNKQLEWLALYGLQLTGSLTIQDFPKLQTIALHDNQLTEFTVLNTPQLAIIQCWNNQLTQLDLTTCSQLTELDCYRNQLTHLHLPAHNNLHTLVCHNNLLTDLDWSNLSAGQLTVLSLSSNNFLPRNLSWLARFTKLKELYLGDNRWTGSLVPLRQLTHLERLGIDNTNLNSDLEYLPANLKELYAAGLPEIQEKMAGFEKEGKYGKCYDYQAWRRANQVLMAQVEQNITRP